VGLKNANRKDLLFKFRSKKTEVKKEAN